MNSEFITKPEISPDSNIEGVETNDLIRANIYRLLAALLAGPPSGEVLKLLEGINDADDGTSLMAAAWKLLKLAGRQTTHAKLDDEFHDLFVGVGRGELVPYACWYMTGTLMGKPLARLRADLAGMGFERQVDVSEPEDHVAALCEIMAMIINSAGEITLDTQWVFFKDYISSWIGDFFWDLQKAKSARFYRAVGRLGEEFMKIEKQYLTGSTNS
jgi:TorA maturation chaperone TorD